MGQGGGFDEVLLKVERDNRRSQPVPKSAGASWRWIGRLSGLRLDRAAWSSSRRQVAMRKDLGILRLTRSLRGCAGRGGAYAYLTFPEQLAEAANLAQNGELLDAARLLIGLLRIDL